MNDMDDRPLNNGGFKPQKNMSMEDRPLDIKGGANKMPN